MGRRRPTARFTFEGREVVASPCENEVGDPSWAFDCPGCGEWGVLLSTHEWERADDGRLTVLRPLVCRRCGEAFVIEEGVCKAGEVTWST